MNHPVVKAGLEIGSVGSIVAWWIGVLPTALGIAATTASLIYSCIGIYYLIRKNDK